MVFYDKNKEHGINWFEMLCFIMICYKIGEVIFNFGIYLGFLVNK